jgi:hypothetical protein
MLIQRQSYHGDYACSLGIVAMSGGDGMDSYSSSYCQAHVGPVAVSCRTMQ